MDFILSLLFPAKRGIYIINASLAMFEATRAKLIKATEILSLQIEKNRIDVAARFAEADAFSHEKAKENGAMKAQISRANDAIRELTKLTGGS